MSKKNLQSEVDNGQAKIHILDKGEVVMTTSANTSSNEKTATPNQSGLPLTTPHYLYRD